MNENYIIKQKLVSTADEVSNYDQMSVSTADEESNYFTGQPEAFTRINPNAILPPGTYRVIEGDLYRIVGGVSPQLPEKRPPA